MKSSFTLPLWTWLVPILASALYASSFFVAPTGLFHLLMAAGLIGAVLVAVHHAEVIAHRVGEPFGTLVLAVAVTVIEVALIVSLMIAGGPATTALARDTVFAAIMIIVNGIVGLSLLLGALRHGEQSFGLLGVNASLATLAAISVLTLVLPNFTVTVPGPFYSFSQLTFIAVVSLVLYGTFVMVQTVTHREYFLPEQVTQGPTSDRTSADASHEQASFLPSNALAFTSLGLLLISLTAVVLMAKSLAPTIEAAVSSAGLPKALVGVVIAFVVLLPEGLAALRAARANRLQTSINLALGSALASIGLTIPAVAIVSIATGWTLTLGLDPKGVVLLTLSLLVATLSLGNGRTTILQGVVHLVIFATYLLVTIVP